MSSVNKPHPLNADGGFYVVDGCCTACDVPRSGAPELFAYDEDNHCYVKRQPADETELDKAVRITWAAELECVRYRGTNPQTIRRIAEMGRADLCDSRDAQTFSPVFRNHVTFGCPTRDDLSTEQLAVEFKQWLIEKESEHSTYKFKAIATAPTCAELTFAWAEDNFHTVTFCLSEQLQWHVFLDSHEVPGRASILMSIYDWLASDSRFTGQKWYSESQWPDSKDWNPIPW